VTMAAIRREEDILPAVAGVDPATTLVFNLCEALGGTAGGESKVPRLLDELGFQYVGATAENLDACLNKAEAKALLLSRGIPTAPYQVFHHPGEPIHVPLPAIVKPVAEDCSLGITRDSVVHDAPALRRQVAYILETYKQPALVEMFLDGREFNVGVWGNGAAHVLPVAEIDFSAWDEKTLRVVNFDAKWNEASSEYQSMPVLCPAPVDPALEDRIRQVALAAYKAMGCRDYARVDLREKGGAPYVLEVNPNPCLATDGGFANAARVAGYDYAHMAHQIAEWAWWRRNHHT
jgi:D-alanine-D-alanine ligase